jgi:molybdopterin converting factor small subunit
MVMLNGENILAHEGLNTKLLKDSQLAIIPVEAGG